MYLRKLYRCRLPRMMTRLYAVRRSVSMGISRSRWVEVSCRENGSRHAWH